MWQRSGDSDRQNRETITNQAWSSVTVGTYSLSASPRYCWRSVFISPREKCGNRNRKHIFHYGTWMLGCLTAFKLYEHVFQRNQNYGETREDTKAAASLPELTWEQLPICLKSMYDLSLHIVLVCKYAAKTVCEESGLTCTCSWKAGLEQLRFFKD